uniref:hypothetical protein n=1 Tax=Pontibacter flavimaris TaxID=1797110 RepID=UPI0011150C6A|nr:hypothetical protein [Pontibacter flavimaris]
MLDCLQQLLFPAGAVYSCQRPGHYLVIAAYAIPGRPGHNAPVKDVVEAKGPGCNVQVYRFLRQWLAQQHHLLMLAGAVAVGSKTVIPCKKPQIVMERCHSKYNYCYSQHTAQFYRSVHTSGLFLRQGLYLV